jgi:hypothetical protein
VTPRMRRRRYSQRLWYAAAAAVAVLLVLLVIGWASGRFEDAAPPETVPVTPPATTQ